MSHPPPPPAPPRLPPYIPRGGGGGGGAKAPVTRQEAPPPPGSFGIGIELELLLCRRIEICFYDSFKADSMDAGG
ncbi:uncharacterized protein ACLA_057990 [Aspergillus clavatus NRRL 1]|uniref:Uncharacterized protein n=1 Tax=Aspergillus clavatus (strain ATCC 1007 / CBS 513.65 / DSM 816 / NCTC 3887 / NRRL 1 / QM 1276 / 107) TaxID=344612 RepID=A1C402_ASPCL|nr:uncharacterized protein ACLA_057990 [Aspergillus clavatus NRRL 1]EAW15142.1 hypothetical protein ACLA_057990 [Aspergillus clavatus NRRL 1]